MDRSDEYCSPRTFNAQKFKMESLISQFLVSNIHFGEKKLKFYDKYELTGM